MYCHFDLTATALATTLRRMEDCLDVVKQWITSNCLCMNDNKKEYLPVVPRTAAALVDSSVIRVGDVTIIASRSVRNLGVVKDLILRRPRSDSATPLLCILHWLPVARRIEFKILVFTYRAVHGDAPKYLCDLICPYTSTRVLRSVTITC